MTSPSLTLDQTFDYNQGSEPSAHSSAASSNADDTPVDVFAILTPKPGNLQRLIKLCELVGQYSKDYEPDCLKYLVYLQKTAPEGHEKTIYLFQQFTNQVAFDEHLDSEVHEKVINEIADEELLVDTLLTSEVYVESLGGFDKTMENDPSPVGTTDLASITTQKDLVNIISVLHPRSDLRPDAQDSIVRACSHVAAYTSMEPGCKKFLVFRQCYPSNDQPGKVILMERYEDQKAFDAHLQADIVKEEMRDCNENLLVKPIDIEDAYVDLVWGFERE